MVPAVVYYEIKRELIRANKTVGIARLDAFVGAAPDRYVLLTDDALRFAAELWARSRQAGRPTADAMALDIDVLLASQALRFGSSPLVATTNEKPSLPNLYRRYIGRILLLRRFPARRAQGTRV